MHQHHPHADDASGGAAEGGPGGSAASRDWTRWKDAEITRIRVWNGGGREVTHTLA
jgi:hypothetical protein